VKFWLGGFQPAGSPEPEGNWQWVTREPFSYSNWNRVGIPPNNGPWEPNDAVGGEDLIELLYAGINNGIPGRYWNDIGTNDLGTGPPVLRSSLVEFTPGFEPRLSGADFLNWQRDLGDQRLYGRADFDGDGVVNHADLHLWETVGFVPEPATATLLLAATGFCMGLRRSRLQKRA
jgi:hypothetical protein